MPPNEIKRLFDISIERYNFVVSLLNQDQRKILHQWYVDTGVIQEKELVCVECQINTDLFGKEQNDYETKGKQEIDDLCHFHNEIFKEKE